MDPRPDLDAEALDVADDLLGAPDGLGRLVERGEEPVAGGVDLPPAVLLETATDERVVGVDDLVPPLVADLGGALGRAHDVREQDRGQKPFGHRRPARHSRSFE